MNHWLSELTQLRQQKNAAALERYNCWSEPFGLVLSEDSFERLLRHRTEVLKQYGRIEFGEGVIGKLIAAFCDSPYMIQACYEETLLELQELFYFFKNECHDLVSDDELLGAMRIIYDLAAGSIEYLSGIDWETMYQVAVTASVEGTELERLPFYGMGDSDESLS